MESRKLFESCQLLLLKYNTAASTRDQHQGVVTDSFNFQCDALFEDTLPS